MRPLLAIALGAFALSAQPTIPTPAIAAKTATLTKLDGFFPLYWDAKAGKLWLEVNKWDTEFLYIDSLPAGLGSNDIGLDRGRLSGERIVKFERVGPKVLLVEPNYRFRAISDSEPERRAVRDSFATSVLAGFAVEAESGERALVDATAFFLRDAVGVTRTLSAMKQGTFRLDPQRSVVYLPRTKNFPRNTEVEAMLTFAGEQPGRFVQEVAPSADSITLREHHSFVQLPDAGFEPRKFDPRGGFFDHSYFDYATPVGEPLIKRVAPRHRLAKGQTLTYYVDPGAPEPIRSALVEGAAWWNQAFAPAGFRFEVKVLPADADPMDVRYNVIQWVHRSTRGWSYGSTVQDPRTGEIIKGHVSLGSLRVRQDYLIAEGVLAPYEQGRAVSPKMLEMGLARLRQLSAHEVGHTLGLAHNYAASVSDRASVMDYPHPWITLDASGVPDLSHAYAVGIGEWDKAAIAYGYGNDDKAIPAAIAKGLVFLNDREARPAGSASPIAHLWDSGANAVDELNRLMTVRAKALERFGERNIREGEAMSALADTLVPVYLLHRYQVEAAAKVLGGLDYRYALRGDGQKIAEIVPGREQARALEALLRTITPETLTLPERLLRLIPPYAAGSGRTRESFNGRTGLTFDPLAAAESAAGHTLAFILDPQRAARLVEYHARDASVPSLESVLDRVVAATWQAARAPGLAGEVRNTVDNVALSRLIALAADSGTSARVRGIALAKLERLRGQIGGRTDAHATGAVRLIDRFKADPGKFETLKVAEPPPGQPIGCDLD